MTRLTGLKNWNIFGIGTSTEISSFFQNLKKKPKQKERRKRSLEENVEQQFILVDFIAYCSKKAIILLTSLMLCFLLRLECDYS